MITGKKLGLKVGDLVTVGAGWPAVIMSDVNTGTPCCEVFGFEQECGSEYATALSKVSIERWMELAAKNGHAAPFKVYGKATYSALMGAGIEAVKL